MTEVCEKLKGIKLTGNVVPMQWLQIIVTEKGKPDLLAIMILADIIYWYRPSAVRDEIGNVISWRKKFKGDLLQKSYKHYAELFGYSKKRIKEAFDLLERMKLIKREFRTIEVKLFDDNYTANNVMFVALNVDNVLAITQTGEITEPENEENKQDSASQDSAEAISKDKLDPPPQKRGEGGNNKEGTNTENTPENISEITSKEKEGVEKEKNKKEKEKRPEDGDFLEFAPEKLKQDKKFIAAWAEWIEHRKETRKKLTPMAAKKQLKFLAEQPNPVKCIENSIMNGWQGLFPYKPPEMPKCGYTDEEWKQNMLKRIREQEAKERR